METSSFMYKNKFLSVVFVILLFYVTNVTLPCTRSILYVYNCIGLILVRTTRLYDVSFMCIYLFFVLNVLIALH